MKESTTETVQPIKPEYAPGHASDYQIAIAKYYSDLASYERGQRFGREQLKRRIQKALSEIRKAAKAGSEVPDTPWLSLPIDYLNDRENRIVKAYYLEGATYAEIAREFGFSASRAYGLQGRIERNILHRESGMWAFDHPHKSMPDDELLAFVNGCGSLHSAARELDISQEVLRKTLKTRGIFEQYQLSKS